VAPADRRPGADWARAQVLALVRARVNVRFRLTADAFTDRLLTIEFVAGAAPNERRWRAERVILDDLYLATACAAGEDDAWREIERKHFAFIRDFAGRFLRGADAEDLAADVMADLWQRRKIAQFEGRSTLRTWLGAVVTRAALNVMAAAPLPLVHEPSEAAVLARHTGVARDGAEEGRTLARFVRRAIDRLDAESKLLLLFHYEQGLSLDHMEPLFGASKATLSRRLKRVRESLRTTVEGLATAEGGPDAAASLGRGIGRAQAEFDLAALLGDATSLKEQARERV